MKRSLAADRAFGSGARPDRVHRWLYAVAAGAFLVIVGLAVWLGFISDVDVDAGTGPGLGGGAQVLVLRIPTLALGRGDGASQALGLWP